MIRLSRSGDDLEVEVDRAAETDTLGAALAAVLRPDAVVGLVGGLGAGKTRLVRAIAEGLGADPGAVSSPTYVLIHEYDARIPVYHFDAYRLDSPDDFEALGAADYWSCGGLCLVEWADRVSSLLPEGSWWLRIDAVDPASERRRFVITPPSAAERDHLEDALAVRGARAARPRGNATSD